MSKQRYLINFIFYDTFNDAPIPHKNFTLLGQGSHAFARPPPPPSALVSDLDTKPLVNRRVNGFKVIDYKRVLQ